MRERVSVAGESADEGEGKSWSKGEGEGENASYTCIHTDTPLAI